MKNINSELYPRKVQYVKQSYFPKFASLTPMNIYQTVDLNDQVTNKVKMLKYIDPIVATMTV